MSLADKRTVVPYNHGTVEDETFEGFEYEDVREAVRELRNKLWFMCLNKKVVDKILGFKEEQEAQK